jgi:hypothetical protein
MRTVLMIAIAFAAPPAWADWVKVNEVDDISYYVDTASIADKDNLRRVAVVQDYAKPQPAGVRSRRVSYDVDCASEALRSVAVTEHAEPMAQGKSVGSWQRQSEWLYVAPRTGSNIAARTPYRSIVRLVCSR